MIEAVCRALNVLELFEGTDVPLRVRDISAALGCAPSSAHRLLATLARLGYVRRDAESHAYYAGDALLALARHLEADVTARAAAARELPRLLGCTNGSASFVVLRDGRVYFVDAARHPGIPADKPAVGSSLELTTTASGKALLAVALPEQIDALVRAKRIVAHAALARELERVRVRGFATSFGETAPGVSVVASPITSSSGRVYGALNVVVRAEHVWRDQLFAIGAEVRDSCRRVGEQLP